jgi:tetratricopeptide (TPR) repeat protein
MRLLDEEAPAMEDVAQLITFQSLALELGNRRLEAGGFRDAIACLRRVWPAARLLKRQEDRIEDLRGRLRAAEADPNSDPHKKFLLAQTIEKVAREIESFQKIASFDAALRFRLASAYQGLGRHREAALILEDMLRRMPPDPVVEQASANLVRTWFELERWPKVAESAAGFRAKFPASESLPLVIYLYGLAAQKDLRFDASLAAFEEIMAGHPDSEFAARALFMKGFTLLLAEKFSDAVRVFEKFPKAHPGHDLAGAAAYWRGMGYSMDRKFEKARGAMDDYLKHFKDGPYAGSAAFRKAYCAQQAEDYQTSIRELRAFLRAYPGHEESAEARLLLGDALMNEGEMEEGIAALQGVPRERTRQREEAVFKIAKALRLMREDDRLMRLMRDFQKENPSSPRVAEAVFQIGSVHRQNDRPDLAREAYWDAIRRHGADPAIRSVDDLFPALSRLYRDEPDEYLRALADLRASAEKSGQPVLAMRALWARAAALRKSDPDASRKLLLEAAKLSDVQTTNPLLLADFATALRDDGKPAESLAMFRDLLKWNPSAPQKDRALAAMGFAELDAGNEAAALALFDRFASASAGSIGSGRVLLAKAALEEKRGRKAAARATLEELLAAPASSGREKAEALFRIGQIHMADAKPDLAIPYFQRIYVMHGRWHEWVAKAYLRSGEAFEKLGDAQSAKNTYDELAKNEDLAGCPESAAAHQRLDALGGTPK